MSHQMSCPAVAYAAIEPSLGTPMGGTRVTVSGVGFGAAAAGSSATTAQHNTSTDAHGSIVTSGTMGSEDYKTLVRCGWGDYALTFAEVVYV